MVHWMYMYETHRRSIIKGITWRIIASLTTMTVVFVVTGDLALVASVGLVDVSAKVFFYYLHERTWGRVHWGVLGPEPDISKCVCDCHTSGS
jgi:adenylylsulfate kinase